MLAREKTGVRFSADSPETLDAARTAYENAGLDAVHVGDALHVGNFPTEGPPKPGTIIQRQARNAEKNLPEGKSVAGRWETGYEGVPWSEKQGTGETTRQVLERLMDDPAYQVKNSASRLDASRLRDTMRPMNEIDRALASEKGLPVREDLLKLREMIADKGIQGVIDYVKKTGGIGLPAIALVPSLAALLGGKQQQGEGT